MIPEEEPQYRPLLENIDIEQEGQHELLGQVSARLIDVEDALEEWGEYYREPKLKKKCRVISTGALLIEMRKIRRTHLLTFVGSW